MIRSKFLSKILFLFIVNGVNPAQIKILNVITETQGCNTSPSGLEALNITVPFFGEISDPIRPCYIYLCIPYAKSKSFAWVERFTQDRCCQFESHTIQFGRKIIVESGTEGDDPCMQTEVSCNLQVGYEPTTPPKILVERKQVRCCHLNGQIIQPEGQVLLPKQCSSAQCLQVSGDTSYEIVIQPIFNSCNCCVMRGQLVPDGQWMVNTPDGKNVTCINGQLYNVEELNNLEETISESSVLITNKQGEISIDQNPTKKCLSCHERRRDIPQIDKSLEIISKVIQDNQIRNSIFILDDRNAMQKSFFRYLASSLPFSDSILGSTLFYGLANKTSESYAYYRWEFQCSANNCEVAQSIPKDFIAVEAQEDSSHRIVTAQTSSMERLKVIAANLKHMVTNSRLTDCRPLLHEAVKKRLLILSLDREDTTTTVLNLLMSNFGSFSLDLDKDLYIVLIVILQQNDSNRVIELPRPLLKTLGIEFYIWKFGGDQALLDCISSCQCQEKKKEKKVQQVSLFQPFFTQQSTGSESCFISLHKYVGDKLNLVEKNCAAFKNEPQKAANIEPQPFPKNLIQELTRQGGVS